eukprot:560549-Amphidinium_carterae.1
MECDLLSCRSGCKIIGALFCWHCSDGSTLVSSLGLCSPLGLLWKRHIYNCQCSQREVCLLAKVCCKQYFYYCSNTPQEAGPDLQTLKFPLLPFFWSLALNPSCKRRALAGLVGIPRWSQLWMPCAKLCRRQGKLLELLGRALQLLYSSPFEHMPFCRNCGLASWSPLEPLGRFKSQLGMQSHSQPSLRVESGHVDFCVHIGQEDSVAALAAPQRRLQADGPNLLICTVPNESNVYAEYLDSEYEAHRAQTLHPN